MHNKSSIDWSATAGLSNVREDVITRLADRMPDANKSPVPSRLTLHCWSAFGIFDYSSTAIIPPHVTSLLNAFRVISRVPVPTSLILFDHERAFMQCRVCLPSHLPWHWDYQDQSRISSSISCITSSLCIPLYAEHSKGDRASTCKRMAMSSMRAHDWGIVNPSAFSVQPTIVQAKLQAGRDVVRE
ncbi:hypothetical protein IG631_04670 [Alternaria alternata]|nr:hypothetical protein IG631_04670 [Alternaria alternata]